MQGFKGSCAKLLIGSRLKILKTGFANSDPETRELSRCMWKAVTQYEDVTQNIAWKLYVVNANNVVCSTLIN
jgi:hypothetical protein